MKSVARRVSDRRVLALVKRWLEAPVAESDAYGHKQRTTRNKDEGRGTPQGAPLSPLLSNLYMRRFVLSWKVQGHERRLDAHIVNYADDFVICCRGSADEALHTVGSLMRRLKLTVNETKTRVCRVPEESFTFLGYTIGQNYSSRTGRGYIGPRPSPRKVQALCAEIGVQTGRQWTWLDPGELIRRLNEKLLGWAHYFCLGNVGAAYRHVMAYTGHRLRQWLGRKHRIQGSRRARYSNHYLRADLGLVWLPALPRPRLLWAKA
jgi:hypothetical protein